MKEVIILAGHTESEINEIKQGFSDDNKIFHLLQNDERKIIIKKLVDQIRTSNNFSSSDIEGFNIPFVFFAYEDRDDIFMFIDKYKKMNIRRSIFSARTDNNINWNFDFMCKDLEEDHKYFLKKEQEAEANKQNNT